MASKKKKVRSSRDRNPRKFKKKTSILLFEDVEYIDYKDVDLLSRFMSDRGKIRNRRITGLHALRGQSCRQAVERLAHLVELANAQPVFTLTVKRNCSLDVMQGSSD